MSLGFRRLAASGLICVSSLAILSVEPSARAQRPLAPLAATNAPQAARLDRVLRRFARAHPAFPGVAVAVEAPGLAWSGAAGVANQSSRGPLAPDATFRIASVTKTFTAAAVLRLMEDGKLALDDAIAKHLSAGTIAQLRRGGYDVGAIRVRHLLQHTSGIYDYAEDPAFQASVVGRPRHRWTRSEQIAFAMRHGKPLAAPGVKFHYSDTGYILLGEMLERESGGSLAAAYRTLLGFERLRLQQTYLETLEPAPGHLQPRAHQYLRTIDTTHFDPSFDLFGGGGLVSTVGNLTRFYHALFAGHVFKHPATLRTMLGNPRPADLTELSMGIFAESIGPQTCWHHDGFWGTSVLDCPSAKVTIAVTVNQATDFDRAVQQLEATVLMVVSRK
jgi:D-alanyl-D-alanine carboxypeptidase